MTPPEVTIASLGDRERWSATVAGTGGPGLTWEYARALGASGWDPVLVEVRSAGGRLVFCAILREWKGRRDVATAYGLSGAWSTAGAAALFGAWHRFAARERFVAGYLQLAAGTRLGGAAGEIDVRAVNDVFVAELGSGSPAALSRNLQAKIAEALARGARVRHGGDDLVAALVERYPETMSRIGAPAQFSSATLEAWATMPGALLVGADVAGRIEAVSLFISHAGVGEYHLNACTTAGRGLAALLLQEAFERLPDLGVRSLNLGGGVRRGDGLAAFKRRFGGRSLPLLSVRQVYDWEAFAAFCAEAGASVEDDWFPPYRRPPAAPTPADR